MNFTVQRLRAALLTFQTCNSYPTYLHHVIDPNAVPNVLIAVWHWTIHLKCV